MRITKVTYRNLGDNGRNAIAACVVVLEDSLMLHDIQVMDSPKGRYVSMPSRDLKGKTRGNSNHSDDVFHPVKNSFHQYLTSTILEGYVRYESDTSKYMYFPEK